ncbi:purine-nucleoside phosphorylase [Nocardia wallacei]|uniref:purine-nucleoside phosphorylase n=1 Tax=Nocardia wallacei TaxID=480035 RepID=UPI00245472FD|nr:purine nucleoside permease [Nocardia wallacei]
MFTRAIGLLATACAVAVAATGCGSGDSGDDKVDVKALIITMFDPEAEPWVDKQRWTHEIPVEGVRTPVRCNDSGLCMMVTDMGKVNASLSTAAVLGSPRLNFDDAYFITAGIAGTPPDAGTLGFAAWARWVVDVDLGHHVLPQDDPNVANGYVPHSKPSTQVYELDGRLVDAVYRNTKGVELADSPDAAQARAAYPQQQGDPKPTVVQCDTATGDNFFNGPAASARAAHIVGLYSGGQGRYCTTQMEDNGTAAALQRAGKLDRYVSLRTASNFDQPHPGQTVGQALDAVENGGYSPGFPLSIENAYRVGLAAADYLMQHPNLD